MLSSLCPFFQDLTKPLLLLFLIPVSASAENQSGDVQVIPATKWFYKKAERGNELILKLLDAAKPTIGVTYRWGGTRLNQGIDCSNYTWQLYRKIGFPYDRFQSTLTLANHQSGNGLESIPFENARPGDLLVYGYRDEKKRWHGHVVILVDKYGHTTGHKGLVLGAHGGDVMAVQFVTFKGYEENYFKNPKMSLRNVLRPDT